VFTLLPKRPSSFLCGEGFRSSIHSFDRDFGQKKSGVKGIDRVESPEASTAAIEKKGFCDLDSPYSLRLCGLPIELKT
jgi:hypothetical protein